MKPALEKRKNMEVSPKIIDIKEVIILKYSFSKFFKSSNILVKLCTNVLE